MHISDELLWKRCLKGDTNSFKELYCRFYPLLYSYGMKLVANHDFIEDTIQDLFVKLIQTNQSLSETNCVKGYLVKAFRNKLYDSLDKQKYEEDIVLHENDFIVDDLYMTIFAVDDPNLLKTRSLMNAFKKMPSHQKEIIYFYYVKDLKHEEIAEILGINYQSSKNLLFRSITKLRKLFFDEQS